MLELLLPLGVLLVLLLALRSFLQLFQNWFLNRTIKEAIDKHPESVPMLLDKLQAFGSGWRQDAFGYAMLAAGFAVGAAAMLDEGDDRKVLIQLALVPLSVGAALLFHYRFKRA
jgi:hypothetical protein